MGGGAADSEGALDRSRGITQRGGKYWKAVESAEESAEREDKKRKRLQMRSTHWGGKKKAKEAGKREVDEAVWRKTVALCLMGVNIIDIKHQLDAWRL